MKKTASLLGCIVLAAVVVSGCGKNKLVEVAQKYEKEVCACKDSACATSASQKFSEETAKNAGDVPTSGSDAEEYSKAVSNATACVTKLATASVPGAAGVAAAK